MDQHYLKNLSIEVLLANAGFNARQWSEYKIPRSRGTSIQDPDTKILVEFFFPDLYEMQLRASNANAGRPTYRTDPQSVTNFEFLSMLREITFFWLQDTVTMLREHRELQRVAPYSTLLEGCNKDTRVKQAFEMFSKKVLDEVERVTDREQVELLNQNELRNALSNGVQRTANMISHRLSQLPLQMLYHAETIADQRNADMMIGVSKAFEQTIQRMAHRMFDVRPVDAHPKPEPRHRPPPPSTHSSPLPELSDDDEAEDGQHGLQDTIHIGPECVSVDEVQQSSGDTGAL